MATALHQARAVPNDTRFFVIMAWSTALTIIAGFSFNLAMGRSHFAAPWQYAADGLIFPSWIGLYLAQHMSVARGAVGLHAGRRAACGSTPASLLHLVARIHARKMCRSTYMACSTN